MIISNTNYPLDILNIGGGFMTIFLIVSLLISLLLANTKYWKKLVPDTLNICTSTLFIVFIIIIVFRVMTIISTKMT